MDEEFNDLVREGRSAQTGHGSAMVSDQLMARADWSAKASNYMATTPGLSDQQIAILGGMIDENAAAIGDGSAVRNPGADLVSTAANNLQRAYRDAKDAATSPGNVALAALGAGLLLLLLLRR